MMPSHAAAGCLLLVAVAGAFTHVAAAAPKPHIMTVLMDDVGWYDTQINNPNSDATPHIGELADAGIRLGRHYAFTVCSPTRRSILSGRFPVTLGAGQANVCSDYLPLPFTLISEKLNRSGYACHFVGKGHLGYATMDHLPINRGFQTHVGYFHADESYDHGEKAFPDDAYSQATTTDEADELNRDSFGGPPHDMWHGDHAGVDVVPDIYYSTNYYSDRAVSFINQHNNASTSPLFIHLPYQCCHSPYGDVPEWERMQPRSTMWNPVYADMLRVLDTGLANVTAAWKAAGMWDNLLMIVSSDNGGSTTGNTANNYPLRGTKTMPFDGGMRVAAFISGGFVPPALRGTTNSHTFMHVADWYPTLCGLAGADPTDDVKGLDGVVRGIDGKDQWAQLTQGSMVQPHDYLPLEFDTIIQPSTGWKLVSPTHGSMWWTPNGTAYGENDPMCKKTLCLFNITADPCERVDLSAANPGIVKALLKQSNSYQSIGSNYAYNTSLYEPMPNQSDPKHNQGLNNFTGYFTPCFRRANGMVEDLAAVEV